MYLEIWMQIVLAISFGACAVISYNRGRKEGLVTGGLEALEILRTANIISINDNGVITPCAQKKIRTKK